MIQDVLRNLGGIGAYGVISLCLFFLVFAGILVWAAMQKRAHLDHMAQLPLESDPQDLNPSSLTHE